MKRLYLIISMCGVSVWFYTNAQIIKSPLLNGEKVSAATQNIPTQKGIVDQTRQPIQSRMIKRSAVTSNPSNSNKEVPVVSVEVGNEKSRSFIQTGDLESDTSSDLSEPVSYSGSLTEQQVTFDVELKRSKTVSLLEKAVAYFKEPDTSVVQACHDFMRTKKFVDGELFIYMYDFKGNCLAHGNEPFMLWRNVYNLRDSFGTYIVQSIIEKAKSGGGWVTYEWRGATRVSYVQKVVKDGVSYALGCGYYPHSKPDAVVNLVKGAVALFNKTLKEGRRKEEAFSDMNYPLGRFVYGDLYIFANDFQGLNYVQGDQPGLIGSNEWNVKDDRGVFTIQEMVNKLKTSDEGIWIEYIFRGATKRSYIEKVVDNNGNYYLIGCGYHPDVNRDSAVNLVRKGYEFMKKVGLTEAARLFNSALDTEYHYGDLFLRVYKLDGTCEAHGGNSSYIGTNRWDVRDEDGRFYVREMIQKGKDGGGWINVKLKNSLYSMYVELVDLGVEEYVISAGIYPISKGETMMLLAKSGINYLQTQDPIVAFAEFTRRGGRFIRGDLEMFAFDVTGICYAYGDDYDLIWRNIINLKDDDGRPFIKIMINASQEGPAFVSSRQNGAQRISYVEQVSKGGRTYVLGSSFYK